MNKSDIIEIENKPKKTTYQMKHRKYYYKTRKYTDAIKRYMSKYEIPLSVYENYVDDDMDFIDLENAYLAINSYVCLLKIKNNLDNHLFIGGLYRE